VQVDPTTARVQVDRAPTPDLDVYVAPGAHEIRAEAAGFQPASQIQAVAAGQTAVVSLKLAPSLEAVAGVGGQVQAEPSTGGVRSASTFVLIGAGALAVGALAMTGVTAASYSQLTPAPRPAPKSFTGDYATELTMARVTDVLWGSAAVVGAVGAGMWFFGGPTAGGGGEVGVTGRW
jgi:hypothetical protein